MSRAIFIRQKNVGGLVKAFLLRHNIRRDSVNHEVPLFTCLLRGDGSVSNKRLIFCYKPNRPLEAALMAAIGRL